MAAASPPLKPLNPFAQEFHPTSAVIATPTLNPFAAPWPNHHHPQSFSQYPLTFSHYPAASVYYTHHHHAAYYIPCPPPSTQQPITTTTNTATTNTSTYSTDFDLQALRPPPPAPTPPPKTPNPNLFSSKRSNAGDARQELRKPWVNGGDLTGKVKFSWKGGFRLCTRGGPVSSVDYCGGGDGRSPPTSAVFKGPSSRRRRPCDRSGGLRRSLSPVVRSYYERMGKRKVKSELIPVKEDGEETTVMIRNIPNQYSREDLIEFLDEYCRRENEHMIEAKINEAADAAEGEEVKTSPEFAYDFVYLPIDFGTHVNRGFAFVNFTAPIAVKKLQLYNSVNPWWEKCDSDKLRDIACAKIQGKRALVDHFDKSVFSCCSDKYLPIFYNPPRDGSSRQVSQRTIGQWIRTTKQPIK